MKTSSAKAKGRALQNMVALALRVKFDWTKALEPDDIKPALMGESGADIKLSPAAKKFIPWDIECKNQETWSIPSWWKQTLSNTGAGRKPLLVIKKNRQEPLVVLRFEDFMEMVRDEET